jgi:hypothetical protein
MRSESRSRESSDEHGRVRHSAAAAHALKIAEDFSTPSRFIETWHSVLHRNFVTKCESKREGLIFKLAIEAVRFEVGKRTSA